MKKPLLTAIAAVVFLVGSCNPFTPFSRELYEIEDFIHPGMMLTQDDLDAMVGHLTDATADDLWDEAYMAFVADNVSGNYFASSTYTEDPQVEVIRNNTTYVVGDPRIRYDGDAAFANALQWVIKKDSLLPEIEAEAEAHAIKARDILNGWSGTLESVGGSTGKLVAGLSARKYCNAAEIIRYTTDTLSGDDGGDFWPEEDIERFKTMLMTVFYPEIGSFYAHSPFSNGNWGLSMVSSVMAIAVFMDDEEMFHDAIEHVTNTRQVPYSTLSGYIDGNTGQCQESGRDQGHSQLGLGLLVEACEIAWNQGVDLYGYLDNRLMKGIEYTVKYNLGYEVPYYQMYGRTETYPGEISHEDRGEFTSIYERVYDHYVHERGYEMPYTRILLEHIEEDILLDIDVHRPEEWDRDFAFWGSLTRNPTP